MAEQQIQVDIDYLRTTRVHICMPCYGGQLTESTFMSFIKWANTCRQLGLDWTVETMTNESLISRARNTLTAKFLTTPNSTHLFFIDADITGTITSSFNYTYASGSYVEIIEQHHTIQSINHKKDWWNNAIAESFLILLKLS